MAPIFRFSSKSSPVLKSGIARLSQAPVALAFGFLAAACGSATVEPEVERPADTPLAATAVVDAADDNGAREEVVGTPRAEVGPGPPRFSSGLTSHRADGNRFAAGKGALPDAEPLDIMLDGRPEWVVAAPIDDDSLWAVVLDDGRVQAFRITGRMSEPFPVTPSSHLPGAPPVLLAGGGRARLLDYPATTASSLTHPVVLPPTGERVAFVEATGDLVVWEGGEISRLTVAALPDARLLVDEASRLLLLTGPTDRYRHGVLGDAIEASRITLLETSPEPRVAARIELEAPDVVEGIAPIWADLDGDGTREIIVTLSNESEGARLVAFSEAGEQLAAGPAIGRGFRWRHQIAVAPFGPGGELELASVMTPHIGGQVEFYRLSNGRLQVVATLSGFSSHALGSRNLDAGLAGDFDGDGQVELAVPDQSQRTLNGVRRSANGAELAWSVSIGGRISTNVAAASLANGDLVVGAGHDGGTLRIWAP